MSHYVVEKRGEFRFAVLGPNPDAGKECVPYSGDRLTVCTTDGIDDANLICDALNVTAPRRIEAPVLRGEFVTIPIAAAAQPANLPSNPFAQYHAALVDELSRIVVPKIPVNPHAEDFEDVADYLVRLAKACDRLLKAVGEEVNRNTTANLDATVFDGAFEAAVQGFATFECDQAAAALREEHDEAEREIARTGKHPDLADEIFHAYPVVPHRG